MIKRSSIVILVMLICLLTSCSQAQTQTQTQLSEQFIQREGSSFTLNGESFRFAGANNYYLNYKDEAMIDAVIEDARMMGFSVIRCWAFLDGFAESNVNNNAFMQTEPGVYDEIPDGARNGFEALDYTIKKASEAGIHLLLVLTNNWDDFGGINQYVEWSDTAKVHDDFYTDDSCIEMYKEYFNYLANRVNTYTNIAYKDDPTIMAWELCNEPRCESDKTGKTLYRWTKEMSRHIKSVDNNHMVCLGDEGFFNEPFKGDWAYNGDSGVDWERNLEIETIDFGTFHLYPEHWGTSFSKDPLVSGIKWIESHIDVAKSIGKPVILEEYGILKNGGHSRDEIYKSWTDCAYESGVSGTLVWILTSIDTSEYADEDGLYPDYDSFRILNDDSSTAQILKTHAGLMSGTKVE